MSIESGNSTCRGFAAFTSGSRGHMAYSFEVKGEVPASCEDVYLAWLSSELHSAMTGGEAVVDPVVGGQFTAWGDYIVGTTLELEPFHRIVQSWRTSQFNDDDTDSQIE